MRIDLLDLGATLERIEVPGPGGRPVPLSLGLATVAERDDPVRNPYLGVTVGRVTNRIAASRFRVDGATHVVQANEGVNQLHGGPVGFSRRIWDVEADGAEVRFRLTSPDGDMGFPGTVQATVVYRLVSDREDGDTIRITHEATTDAPTPISMTNHTYWNLAGPTVATVDDHLLAVDAETVVPVDDALLPSGPPVAVADSEFDLRRPVVLGSRIGRSLPDGYDHCFVVGGTGLRRHARLEHRATARTLEVWSDQPALQVYTGGALAGDVGADGRTHHRFGAICLEPQHIPDAVNLDWAPSPVVRPGERYVHELEFRLHVPRTDQPETS